MSVFAPRRTVHTVIVEWGRAMDARTQARISRQRHAARQTRRAWWRWIALLVAAVVVAALQTGCAASLSDHTGTSGGGGKVNEYNYESPGKYGTAKPGASKMDARSAKQVNASPAGAGKVAFDAPDDASSDSNAVSPETRLLAEQSARDVELLLARQQTANQNTASFGNPIVPAANTLGAPTPEVTPRPAPVKREIQWNTPSTAKSDAANSSATTASALQAVPPHASPAPPTTAPDQIVPQPPASQPAATALRPDRIQQLTVDLARELYAAGAYSEHPLRELTVIAAMGMNEPQRRIDPNAIPDLTEEERALLANLQTFFISLNESLEHGSNVNAGVAQAAATLRQSLIHEPQLKLPTLALCTRVGGFGEYEPFERNTFVAGADQKAIVYVEIEDFVSEINQNNEFVTQLSQQLTIFSDRDGIPVWHEDWQQANDITRNKRQDFFTTQVITIPKTLSVGKYTLKVRVRDDKSKAESETSMPFELVADAKMLKRAE